MSFHNQVNHVTNEGNFPLRETELEELLLGENGLVVEHISEHLPRRQKQNQTEAYWAAHSRWVSTDSDLGVRSVVYGCEQSRCERAPYTRCLWISGQFWRSTRIQLPRAAQQTVVRRWWRWSSGWGGRLRGLLCTGWRSNERETVTQSQFCQRAHETFQKGLYFYWDSHSEVPSRFTLSSHQVPKGRGQITMLLLSLKTSTPKHNRSRGG